MPAAHGVVKTCCSIHFRNYCSPGPCRKPVGGTYLQHAYAFLATPCLAPLTTQLVQPQLLYSTASHWGAGRWIALLDATQHACETLHSSNNIKRLGQPENGSNIPNDNVLGTCWVHHTCWCAAHHKSNNPLNMGGSTGTSTGRHRWPPHSTTFL